MPAVIPPNSGDQFMAQILQDIKDRLRALELPHNGGVSDPQGRMRVVEGMLEDGRYGTNYYDTGGHQRVRVGELANGDFGLAIYSAANDGTYRELWPISSKYAAAAVNATSTAYSAVAGVPSLTATLGASGDAIVTVSAYIQPSANGQTGTVGLKIDSGGVNDIVALGDSAGIPAGNVSSTRRLSDWIGTVGSGPHTFGLQIKCSTNGTAVQFGAMSIVVEPI